MMARNGRSNLQLATAVVKLVATGAVILGAIFTAGRLVERMRHEHQFLMHEMCRIEVRLGMEAPEECTVVRANQTQAAET